MRIIAGKFKGRRLTSFNADHIRPTSDKVKGSLFNRLQWHWQGAKVLDLFSGTGNLAIEAHSRGAALVTCVELDKKSLNILNKNLDLLEISSGINIVNSDVLKFIKQYRGKAFDIVLIDPPFTKKMAHSVMDTLTKSKLLHSKSNIAIESYARERLDDVYDVWHVEMKKKFGYKHLSFYSLSSFKEEKHDNS